MSKCFKRKRDKWKDDRSKNNYRDKAVVSVTKADEKPTKLALTVLQKAFINSGATGHLMKDVSVITGKDVPSNISIGTANKDSIKATAQGGSIIGLSGGQKPVILNRVLRVSDVGPSLVYVSNFCDDGHTIELTSKKCLVKKGNCGVVVGERAGGMYSISLQLASDRAIVTPDVTKDMLSVWHARLAYADCNAMRKMKQSDAVQHLKMAEARCTNNCLPCIERRMTNTPTRFQATHKSRSRAELPTDVAEMNVPSVGGAK